MYGNKTKREMSLMLVLDRMDLAFTRACPLGVGVLGVTAVYYVAFSYGLGVIALVFGKDGVTQVLGVATTAPFVIGVGVPLIPISLIFMEAYDLEGRALLYWRTTISPKLSQLPLVGWLIDWFWPTPIRQPLHSGADGLGGSIDFLARSFSAGLLLPFAAFIVGRVCFQSTKNSYKRVALGGLLFFSLKTLMKMYLRQQEYRRQGFRRVLNYDPSWDK